MKPRLIAIVGPTAGGKSAVGAELARRLRGEVISCDSMQVYRGMPICTQSPKKIVRGIRHHLVSFVDPAHEYSAARFRRDAEKAARSIVRRGKTPVLVGGTGLYLCALLDGLFDSRPKDERYRAALRAEAVEKGNAFLHERLRAVDPDSASGIHPNDVRRVIRALEVHRQTGTPMSSLKPRREGLRTSFDCRVFLLDRSREDLYARIGRRVDKMVKQGLAKELKRLQRKQLSRTASMALGIREKGNADLLKQHTRNYAKRQLSWFRREEGIEIVPVGEKDAASKTAAEILKRLQRHSERSVAKRREVEESS